MAVIEANEWLDVYDTVQDLDSCLKSPLVKTGDDLRGCLIEKRRLKW